MDKEFALEDFRWQRVGELVLVVFPQAAGEMCGEPNRAGEVGVWVLGTASVLDAECHAINKCPRPHFPTFWAEKREALRHEGAVACAYEAAGAASQVLTADEEVLLGHVSWAG